MPAHLLAVTQAGIGTLEWLRTNGVRIGLVLVLAFAVSRLGHVAIGRMRRKLEGDPSVTGPLSLRRTTTVVELTASVIRVVIWSIATLLILGELGLDLGPLIAGAGIVGVALAFGAQSLVRDFLSGFFIIFENQFAIGDSVEIVTDVSAARVDGRVEGITLRTTSLRGSDGVLHVVPNGNLHIVSNRSRGQARVIVEVHVPRGEDLEEIRRVLTALCEELQRDGQLSARLFSGPEVIGVERATDETVLLRVAADSTPARADAIRDELGRRIEQRFVAVPHEIGVR
jgi:small-conductance mechanosensitive channel